MSSRSTSPENDVFSIGLIPERENKSAGTTQADFDGLLSEPLLLHEDLKEGCGGQLWPAGITLTKYMLKHHPDLTGKKILEIGTGGGLVGLAVARGCKTSAESKLIITDQIPMLALMQQNIALNSLEGQVQAAVYDWGAPMPLEVSSQLRINSAKSPVADIVLAADCVYFEPAFPLLLHTLVDIIGSTTVCYFCFKKRRKADMRFIRDLHKTFMVKDVIYNDMESDRHDSVYLYEVTKRPS